MITARIVDGIVVNVEVWDQEALATDRGPGQLVPVPNGTTAHIGLAYDPAAGFEQPPAAPPVGPYTDVVELPADPMVDDFTAALDRQAE
jgi:hypothetical protein